MGSLPGSISKKSYTFDNLFVLRWTGIALVLLSSYFLALTALRHIPTPIECEKDALGQFTTASSHVCVDRARSFLKTLTSFGPKPAGSYENEILTKNLIIDELQSIQNTSSGYMKLEYETQTATGIDHWGRHYSNVQNIIARLSMYDGVNNKALLVNSHFDSAKEGPGASDDEVNLVAMLEVLRSIMINPNINLNYDIIFLFNGAEESGLLASHGFITQHKWKNDISAFINLEACGSGGKEMLFQTTSKKLMHSYINAAPYPFSNVVGQEIFQAGIIPSDTDFRIFRDYGNAKEGGLDFAFIENGYVYHTIHDTIDKIPDGSIQQAGDNLLHIVTDFAAQKSDNNYDNTVDMVFFDVFGIFMISYSWKPTGLVLNLLFACFSFLIPIIDLLILRSNSDVPIKKKIFGFVICLISFIAIWILSFGFSFLTAYLLGSNGFAMSWYTNYSFLFLLYSLPVFIAIHIVFTIIRILVKKENLIWICMEDVFFHTCNFIFGIITLLLTIYGVKSSFLFNYSLISNIIWWLGYKITISVVSKYSYKSTYLNEKHQTKEGDKEKWAKFISYILFQVLPLMMWSYIFQALLTVLVPTMGRNGINDNPEILICILMTSSTLLLVHYFLPLLLASSKQYIFAILFILPFIITIIVLFVSSVGFPFRNDPANPTTKRMSIMYTRRQFIDPLNDITQTDAGYLTLRYDYVFSSELVDAVPEYKSSHAINETECSTIPGCGYPLGKVGQLWTKEVSVPNIPHECEANLTIVNIESVKVYDANLHNLTIEMNGPSSVKVLLSPYPNTTIISSGPYETLEENLEMNYIRAAVSPASETFWLLVKGWKENSSSLGAVIIGYYRHGDGVLKPGDNEFVDKHPDWVAPFSYIVDYKYYSNLILRIN